MNQKDKAKIILNELEEYISIDWNFEQFYLKGIENGLKKIKEKEEVEKLDLAMDQAAGAINFIQENYAEPEITLSLVAEKFHVSTSYLSRLIKQQTGSNFSDYITGLRIRQAKELLSSDKHMIYEVASMIGYSSQHYFCRIFKEHTGCSPSDYRMNLKNKK